MLPIAFLPYEDEWIYSWFHRLAIANGFSLEMFKSYIYQKEHVERTWNWRMKGLFWLQETWKDLPPLKDLILNHSVLPGNMFSENEAYISRQFFSLLYDREDLLYDAPPISKKLRYRICPRCMEEDEQRGKDLYVKTWHSYSEVKVCYKHKCGLIETTSFPPEWKNLKIFSYTEEAWLKAEQLYRVFRMPDRIPEEMENHLRKYDESDELTVMQEYPLFTVYQCKTCKTEFMMPPYLISMGRECPVCELSRNVPDRMMKIHPGYNFTKEITSFTDRNCICHEPCGNVFPKSAWNLLWDNMGWKCDCEDLSCNRKRMTKKEVEEKYKLHDYDILDCQYKNGRYYVKLKHSTCETVFEKVLYYGLEVSIHCPECRERETRKRKAEVFDKRLLELTGDEYKRESIYNNQSKPVRIRHLKCQKTILCTPGDFINDGIRCGCEKPKLTDEVMEELFSVFVQNFEILDYNKKSKNYTIKFKNGGVKKIKKGKVYVDATCRCKPRYFDREKEPWGLHDEYKKYIE